MGRPLKKSFFGSPATAGAQVVLNSARIAGQSAAAGYYIVRQVGTGRFQVTNGSLTGVVRLVAAGTLQEGEAHAIVKPHGGGADEYARVIHNRSVKTWSGNSYAWSTAATTTAGQAMIVGTVAVGDPFTLTAAITGTAQVGQTLTAVPTPAGHLGSVTYTYRWLSATTTNGTYAAIGGATASTYVVAGGQESKFIKVEITGTDANADVAVGTSAATTVVLAA